MVEGDPNKTGQALTQHKEKLRTRVFEAGGMVPPWNGRDNCPALLNENTGVCKLEKAVEHKEERFVTWDKGAQHEAVDRIMLCPEQDHYAILDISRDTTKDPIDKDLKSYHSYAIRIRTGSPMLMMHF